MTVERPPIARPNYFAGEALLTDDFVREQHYHMEMLAVMNRGLHTWGVAEGLEVYWQDGAQSRQVRVAAGMAIDRLGREIVLTEPRVVTLADAETGSLYYLTIRYHDAYADLTDQTGVLGYKRIVQEPLIEYSRSLPEPGVTILLAVVGLSSQGAINSLTYRAGAYQRRYVGGRFGRLELVVEGSGVLTGALAAAEIPVMSVSALLETTGNGTYLAFDAGRSWFSGALSTAGDAGIGVDQPQANLEVESITAPGPGQCTTNGTALMLSKAIIPPLQPGDTIIPEVSISEPPPRPGWGVIAAATSDPCQYLLGQAFTPDLTRPHSYSFMRGVVARVAAPVDDPRGAKLELLRIDRNGTLGLGVPATPASGTGSGAAALTITSDRRVGIGLTAAPAPGSRLEVNGNIQAASLSVLGDILANGTVKAGSFEGNGAKLKNLPILSYWTKVNPTSTYSPIYYASGSVCVQTSSPLGSLTVGSGQAFVGSGLVTTSDATPNTLIGNQTQFQAEINPGDTIVVGTLRQLVQTVATVVSDTQLVLDTQFPVLLLRTPYKIGAGTNAKNGAGTISSNGTMITGTGTAFTKDVVIGDTLQVADFVPNNNAAGNGATGWIVGKVNDQNTLTLIPPTAPAQQFPATLSAFMVRPSLMGYFQDSNPIDGKTTLNVPAMLVVSNALAVAARTTAAANTVAINYDLEKVDPQYALMVNGPTNFTGGGLFDMLSVTGKAKIGGIVDASSPYRLQVSNGDFRADDAVSVGGNVTADADVTATGNITATKGNVTAGADVTATKGNITAAKGNITAAGNVTATTGSLTGAALAAAGVRVNTDGSVNLFGNVSSGSVSKSSPAQFTASTDGFVLCRINAGNDMSYGVISCNTNSISNTVSVGTMQYSTTWKTYRVGQAASSLTPVKKGERVNISISGADDFSTPSGYYYWIPLGPSKQMMAAASPSPAATDALKQLDDMAQVAPNLDRQTSLARAQALGLRFANALDQAAGRNAAAEYLSALAGRIADLTCSARQPNTAVSDDAIWAVVETLIKLFDSQLPQNEMDMLADSIRGMIDIPRKDAQSRIDAFLDCLQKVFNTQLSEPGRKTLELILSIMVGMDDAAGGT